MSWKLALWSALAGGLIPVMAVLNARLGRAIGVPIHALVVLTLVALCASLLISLFMTRSLPTWGTVGRAAPMDLLGGVIVCFYVLSATLLAPRIGIGNFILFAVATQTITSALVDHFGLFGAMVREVSGLRAAGIVLLIVGLVITQVASQSTSTQASP